MSKIKITNKVITKIINHFSLTNENRIKESQARSYLEPLIEFDTITSEEGNEIVENLYSKDLLTKPKGKETYSQAMLDFEKQVSQLALEYTKKLPEYVFLTSKGSIRFLDKNNDERSYSSNYANDTMRALNRKASENKKKIDALEK